MTDREKDASGEPVFKYSVPCSDLNTIDEAERTV
jgi:hypothetical protein